MLPVSGGHHGVTAAVPFVHHLRTNAGGFEHAFFGGGVNGGGHPGDGWRIFRPGLLLTPLLPPVEFFPGGLGGG